MGRTNVCLFAFVVLGLVSFGNTQGITTDYLYSDVGTAGDNVIWYQSSNFFQVGNVRNPIGVSIVYQDGDSNTEASVCVNSFESSFPISGANLRANCPVGGFSNAANATTTTFATKSISRKYSSVKSQFLGSRLALAEEDFDTSDTIAGSAYLKPSSGVGLIVTLPDASAAQKFQVILQIDSCNDTIYYPVASDGSCVEIPTLPIGGVNVVIPADSWQYYQYTVDQADFNVNSLEIAMNSSNVANLFIQSDYYPTENWYFNTEVEVDDDDLSTYILSPGFYQAPEVFFFGIQNTAAESITVSLNVTQGLCDSNNFGLNCQHQYVNATDPLTGYLPLSVTLTTESTNSTIPGQVNNGTAWRFDYDDDDYEGDYAYFSLDPTTYPTFSQNYSIRVSVGNNNVKDGAPGFFAKRGAIPSAQSNHYNVSTEDDTVHQIVVPISAEDFNADPSRIWYFAVQLPADFSIWVVVNCANNCDEEGSCYCNNDPCPAVDNTTDPTSFYTRPTSLKDSAGACSCDDSKYEDSFDCSTKKNPYLWAWILLIVVVVLILLFVVIALPVFFIIQRQRKRSSYDILDYQDE